MNSQTASGLPEGKSVIQFEADIRKDERQKCWNEINAHIKAGPLPGNGRDDSAERNGLILAANLLLENRRC